MKTFIDPNLLRRLRVGPLAPYLDAYLKHIEQEGFVPSSAPMQRYAIARFSKWLRDRQFDLHQVKEEILAKTTPINAKKKGRYQPDDDLLAFLKGL